MNQRGGDRPRDGRDERRDRDRGNGNGPPDTQWLELEPSRVVHGRAQALATEAAEEILKEAIKARLRERLGERLEAIAHLAADTLADDIEANLEIEAKIAARREARHIVEKRVDEIFGIRARDEGRDDDKGPPGENTGEGWDPRKV